MMRFMMYSITFFNICSMMRFIMRFTMHWRRVCRFRWPWAAEQPVVLL